MNSFLTHISAEGERWDQLAWRYYTDPLAYGRILAANPHVPMVAVLPAGWVLSVPVLELQQPETGELPPWMR